MLQYISLSQALGMTNPDVDSGPRVQTLMGSTALHGKANLRPHGDNNFVLDGYLSFAANSSK
jgi:hypothetical protein